MNYFLACLAVERFLSDLLFTFFTQLSTCNDRHKAPAMPVPPGTLTWSAWAPQSLRSPSSPSCRGLRPLPRAPKPPQPPAPAASSPSCAPCAPQSHAPLPPVPPGCAYREGGKGRVSTPCAPPPTAPLPPGAPRILLTCRCHQGGSHPGWTPPSSP